MSFMSAVSCDRRLSNSSLVVADKVKLLVGLRKFRLLRNGWPNTLDQTEPRKSKASRSAPGSTGISTSGCLPTDILSNESTRFPSVSTKPNAIHGLDAAQLVVTLDPATGIASCAVESSSRCLTDTT